MGQGRVELPTSRLSGVRSNHLSYWPDEEFLIGASVADGADFGASRGKTERKLGPSKLSPITNCRSLEQPSDVLLALP